MKIIQSAVFICALALGLMEPLKAAVTSSITPSTVSNTYTGTITLQIDGLTNGETVVVQKYVDVNGNGVIDTNDWMEQQFQLTVGQTGAMVIGVVTNVNVPFNSNPNTNAISSTWSFQVENIVYNGVGQFLFKVWSPTGQSTNSLTVTNSYSQEFTGTVLNGATPVPNAIVLLYVATAQSPTEQAVGGALANNAGVYNLQAPVGTYTLLAAKPNFVANPTTSAYLVLTNGQTRAADLRLIPATETISGKIIDAVTSNGLPGVFFSLRSTDHTLGVATFTDTNGNFSVGVTSNAWSIGGSDEALALLGYVGVNDSSVVDTTTGSVSNLTIARPKATALFYGYVRDNSGYPLPGIFVGSDDCNGDYENDVLTDGNGYYVTGAVGGQGSGDPWEVNITYPSFYPNYSFAPSWFTCANWGTNLATNSAALANFTATLLVLATNGLVVNGGFETGDFPPWTLSGSDTGDMFVDNGSQSGIEPHSGNYLALCGPVGSLGSLSQTLSTTLGTTYLLSLWLDSPDGETPNEFFVSWNGSTLLDQLDFPKIGWTNIQFFVTATGTNAILQFGFLNDNSDFGFDDVSVVRGGPLAVATTSLPMATNSVSYNQTLAAFGGQPPYSWTNSFGMLPSGLRLSSNGVLSGTPLNTGTNYFTVQVTDATNSTASQTLALAVVPRPLQVTTLTLPNGQTGVAYRQQLSAIYGLAPYSWSLLSGSLPSGLALPTNGVISGIPIVAGIANFDVAVTDTLSVTGTASLTLAISTSNTASIFTPLYDFSRLDSDSPTNSDGAEPAGALIVVDNKLYGAANNGGIFDGGAVFAINTDGTSFTNLYNFNGNVGIWPNAPLVLSGDKLYGTALFGGDLGSGAVFALTTNGTGFTNLYSFTIENTNSAGVATNGDGAFPTAPLVLSGNWLFGAASGGGTAGDGTIFAVMTNGTGFTNVYSFTPQKTNNAGVYTNGDGAYPIALILSGSTLYGTANSGGRSGNGTVFAVKTNGTGFTNLFSFTIASPNSAGVATNGDGAFPTAPVVLSGNWLYGTASAGGPSGNGTVFAVKTNGTGFTNLYSFTIASPNSVGVATNGDGAFPTAPVVLSGNWLYGTASAGGLSGNGTVFAVKTNGTGFTNLYSFTGGGDGGNPDGLILSGNILYGITQGGGYSGNGTVFSISLLGLAPSSNSIFILLASPQIVGKTNFTFQLSGPAGSNYVLQVSTNLLIWCSNSTFAIPASGTTNLTNAISGYNRRFYRAMLQ